MTQKKVRVTQRQAIFYQLYNARLKDPEQYVPIWHLIGEVYVEEKSCWGFVSYEVSARMSELYSQNPNLFERRMMTGKTGARYYGYRISHTASMELIKDEELLSFYKLIKRKRNEKESQS